MTATATPTTIIEQIKARLRDYKAQAPGLGIDLDRLHVRLTEEQWLSIDDTYKDSIFRGLSIHTNHRMSVLGGIRVFIVNEECDTGLNVHAESLLDKRPYFHVVGEPFTMDDTRSTSRRLNDIRTSYVPKGMPSDEEQQALVDWIVKSNTGGLDELPVMPDWYKPIAAYHQLRTMDATDHGKLAPWHIPTEWVNKLSAMWLCTMKANMIVHAQIEEAEQAQAEQSKRNPPAQSKFHIGKTDSRGGNA